MLVNTLLIHMQKVFPMTKIFSILIGQCARAARRLVYSRLERLWWFLIFILEDWARNLVIDKTLGEKHMAFYTLRKCQGMGTAAPNPRKKLEYYHWTPSQH